MTTNPPRIHVINPNSTHAVTEGIARAVAPFSAAAQIDCLTLVDGPPAIESHEHVEQVVPLLEDLVRESDADAAVIACYSDPGLEECREAADLPVFGIAESAMALSLTRAENFGVISILDTSIPRHLEYVDTAGLMERFAGDRAVGLGVLELESAPDALERLVQTGRLLVDEDGADVIILGCAGMADQRGAIEDALGVPVIEPCQAAVASALAALLPA